LLANPCQSDRDKRLGLASAIALLKNEVRKKAGLKLKMRIAAPLSGPLLLSCFSGSSDI
jgi:hypothetical protein